MTEHEWNASTSPPDMLRYLTHWEGRSIPRHTHPLISPRKLRLFAFAVYPHVLPHNQSHQNALERCEASEDDYLVGSLPNWLADYPSIHPIAAMLLRDIVQPFAPVTILQPWNWRYECRVCGNMPDDEGELRHGKGCYTQSEDGGGEEWFDPEERKPSWLTSATRAHAEHAYQNRLASGFLCPLALATLADALEESGCTDPAILEHLKGRVRCAECDGTKSVEIDTGGVTPWGASISDSAPCEACHGQGWVRPEAVKRKCEATGCHLGKVFDRDGYSSGWFNCPACKGAGFIAGEPVRHARGCAIVDALTGRE